MDRETQETIELLRRLRAELPPDGPVTLSEEYVRAVERAEELPRNRTGSDKSWVDRAGRAFRAHYARVARG